MTTDLAGHIADARVVGTHEHVTREAAWIADGPADLLQSPFENDITADRHVHGSARHA